MSRDDDVFVFPCVGETLREPGDFGYRARVLVFTCERVRANARAVVGVGDATENAAMRMHGDTLKRMIERFGEDVFASTSSSRTGR